MEQTEKLDKKSELKNDATFCTNMSSLRFFKQLDEHVKTFYCKNFESRTIYCEKIKPSKVVFFRFRAK